MKDKSFYFIGNILETDIELPIHINYGYELKKANSNQIKIIKTRLELIQQATQLFPININPYESEFIKSEKDNSYLIKHPKNTNQWKYWIIELDCYVDDFEKQSENISKNIKIIDSALLVSESNIQLLWGFLHYRINEIKVDVDGISSQSYRPLNFFKSLSIVNPKTTLINTANLNEIQQLTNLIEKLFSNDKYLTIRKIIDDLINFYEIPPKSPYRIIGLFSILEYLLTTFDSGKSINKQLQTKLNLLNNRFSEKLNVSEFFKISTETKFEKIIEKLYAYRSDIAHGNNIDFEKKLQILNNNELVENFLLTMVKRTIKQSLFEPDLILDLKKC
ncbi:hypothetical protein [Saccharicrinis sp. FJH54]|uniref:hypothetical protein n=1 Tax=Saccharicrinis sp. FJH54 TaxID=3344665 RepID=UPI0035D43C7A